MTNVFSLTKRPVTFDCGSSIALPVGLSTWTPLPMDVEYEDLYSLHSLSVNTSRITVVSPGYYQFYLSFAADAIITLYSAIRKNGTLSVPNTIFGAGSTLYGNAQGLLYMDSGDYVEPMAFFNTAGNVASNTLRFTGAKI